MKVIEGGNKLPNMDDEPGGWQALISFETMRQCLDSISEIYSPLFETAASGAPSTDYGSVSPANLGLNFKVLDGHTIVDYYQLRNEAHFTNTYGKTEEAREEFNSRILPMYKAYLPYSYPSIVNGIGGVNAEFRYTGNTTYGNPCYSLYVNGKEVVPMRSTGKYQSSGKGRGQT